MTRDPSKPTLELGGEQVAALCMRAFHLGWHLEWRADGVGSLRVCGGDVLRVSLRRAFDLIEAEEELRWALWEAAQ